MKVIYVIKILFILNICLESLWATTHESGQILDSLAPMRMQQLPSLTPRRPLRFCIGDSPSDMPQTRSPLNVSDPLRLYENESGRFITRLGENPPLRLLNRPVENFGFMETTQMETAFSPLQVGGSGGTTLSVPSSLPQQMAGGGSTLISPGAIPIVGAGTGGGGGTIISPGVVPVGGGGGMTGGGSTFISPGVVPVGGGGGMTGGGSTFISPGAVPIVGAGTGGGGGIITSTGTPTVGGGAIGGAEEIVEQVIPDEHLLAGKEAISKEAPKVGQKTVSQKIPKSKKTVTPKKHVPKKHPLKKTIKSKSHPKKTPPKTSGRAIPRKTYLKDLKEKYNQGYKEGQKHPDCAMCQLPEYLR